MSNIKSIVVFCASSSGNDEAYRNTAFELGRKLAGLDIELIYGGGKVGLMGALANGALKGNGKVTGIIPDFMTPHEVAHNDLTELLIVKSMHERKMLMHEMSDAVITLPGGFGTFEELFEILTWVQLGLYQKPVGILNQKGYYNHLEKQLDHMSSEGLLKATHRPMLHFSESIEKILHHFDNYIPIPNIFELKKNQT